jgi:hypothetical protein
MTNRENILNKIKNMLDLAGNAGTEHEAALAASMAHKFMEKHNLCMSEVSEFSTDDTEIREESVHESGRLATWKMNLLHHGVAPVFNCRVLINSGYRKRTLRLVGTKADMAIARVTFEYLVGAVERLSRSHAKGCGRSYINSYKLGAVATVCSRLKAQARENREEVEQYATKTGTALAVVKGANLKNYMSKFTGKYRTSQSRRDHYGYDHGRSDGHDVGLNAQVGGSSGNRLT